MKKISIVILLVALAFGAWYFVDYRLQQDAPPQTGTEEIEDLQETIALLNHKAAKLQTPEAKEFLKNAILHPAVQVINQQYTNTGIVSIPIATEEGYDVETFVRQDQCVTTTVYGT